MGGREAAALPTVLCGLKKITAPSENPLGCGAGLPGQCVLATTGQQRAAEIGKWSYLGGLNPSSELCKPLQCLLVDALSGSSALQKPLTEGPKKNVLFHLCSLL